MITYNAGDFFENDIADIGILREKIRSDHKWKRPLALRHVLDKFKPDGVIAFMAGPSFYSEISSIIDKRWTLIVSERSTEPAQQQGLMSYLLRHFYYFADYITTNSDANHRQLIKNNPSLSNKIFTIRNAVDLERFRPVPGAEKRDYIKLTVLASHKPARNFKGLADAVNILSKDPLVPAFAVSWYGDEAPGYTKIDEDYAASVGVSSIIRIIKATKHPEEVLNSSDALILPSFWEGMPNSACEALAVGCPIILSDVSDARFLVNGGKTGFLFDPLSSESLSEAIRLFMNLPESERNTMRSEARIFAERELNPSRMASEYETLIKARVRQ